MAEHQEAMWLVTRATCGSPRYWIFRTRTAARKFAADKMKRSPQTNYTISRATWGPEQ